MQKGWKDGLTPLLRTQIADLHPVSAWTWLKIPVLFSIWAVAAMAAINNPSWWIRVPCWVVIGFVLHGLGVFMHEGAHGALFRVWWLNRLVGFVCGLPVFFSCSCYRATHLLHHQYENTGRDPDNVYATVRRPLLRWFVYFGFFLIGAPLYIVVITIAAPFRASGYKEKLACLGETFAIAAIHGALFYTASRYALWPVLLNGWLLGGVFAVLIANFRGLAEHTQLWHADPPDPFRSTRTTRSNPIIGFFFNNQNYHLEHHLFPGIPWNKLPQVHRLMRPVYREREAAVCTGYVSWAVRAFRYGPNRTLHYTADHSPVVDPPHSFVAARDARHP